MGEQMNPDMLNNFTKKLSSLGINYQTNEPLNIHSTFKIGGNAEVFAVPSSEIQLSVLVELCSEYGVRFFVLGKGSNILFDDSGFDGVVISTSRMTQIRADGDRVTAQCGASVTRLAAFCEENSLTGLEFMYGIPGSVGGAVYMNAGAYGGEISFSLVETVYFDVKSAEIKTLSAKDHRFGYRTTAFQWNNWVILSSVFQLEAGDRNEISAKMEDYLTRRRDKQPLEMPSAGSTFKRCEGAYTGQMIEEAGLKGYRIGGAQVSEKHAGFIVNAGGATSKDVLELVAYVQKVILEKFGKEIQCEMIHVK